MKLSRSIPLYPARAVPYSNLMSNAVAVSHLDYRNLIIATLRSQAAAGNYRGVKATADKVMLALKHSSALTNVAHVALALRNGCTPASPARLTDAIDALESEIVLSFGRDRGLASHVRSWV